MANGGSQRGALSRSDSLLRYSPTRYSPAPMLILAIDTALDACAAGVLDTDAAS